MAPHKSEDFKIAAVEYYLKSKKTKKEICKIFSCSQKSLKRWTNRYLYDKTIKRHNRKSISYKVKNTHVQFIKDTIKKNKTITMNNLLDKIKLKYKNFNITPRHLSRIIKDNNITLKLTRYRHEPQYRFGKQININKKVKEFYNEVKKFKLKDIICIDETSISSLMKRYHCYSEIGKRCIIKTQDQNVFKKYTAIFAISSSGIIGWDLYEKGGMDTYRLKTFLETYITNKYRNKLIILDNASSHRNELIKSIINKDNKLLLSVPYQHFTNSIENYFSMMKSRLNKLDGLTHKELKTNIEKVIKDIPKEKYENIIKGTYNRTEKYVKKTSNRKKTLKNYK